MVLYKRFWTAAITGLLLCCTAFSAMADINNNKTIIDITITGNVTGNKGVNNQATDLNTDSNVPQVSNPENVYDNHVIIKNDGRVSSASYGGITYGNGNVYKNTLTIENGGFSYYSYGGSSADTGDVTDNTVTINGAVNYVYGGYSDGAGNVTNNAVTVSGTVIRNVYSGYTTGTGYVTDNTVTVTVSGRADIIYGGYSDGTGDVTDNIVTINGTVINNVYGGHTTGTSMVSDNTVNITNTANLTSASLWGSNKSGVSGTGNTLNVDGFNGSMNTMGNFEYYNFVLGVLNNQTFIEITGSAVNIDDTEINISFAPEFQSNVLNVNDVITVISSINTAANPASVTVAAASPFVSYDFSEAHDAGALLLTITAMALNPTTEALGEAFAAGLAFLGQAADLRSHIYFVPQGPRFIPFAKMVYGKQYISTGSSVNVKGFSAIAGLALNTNFDNGSQLVVGAFVEGGWGDYDSRHSFSNSSAVKGKGDTEYYGGGVLARYAMASGLYGEGTFAAGKTETDFKSRDFAPGTTSKYDYSVPYYSAHVAVGQVLNLTEMLKLDIYGKYLWTRQAGDNVTVNGYRFKFKDADSHRLRAGGKLQADASPQLQPYAGAAYEYEFGGKISGSLYGMHLDKPSLRGSTGIGEVGLVWSPTESDNFKVDLGAQGYVGKREGISGGLTVTMSF